MIVIEGSKDPAAGVAEVDELLKTDSHYVPALMVRAAINLQRGEAKAAEEIYNAVLQILPEFAPAQKQLAGLYAESPEKIAKAYDLATKARKTLDRDPDLMRILGVISFQRKEYARAIQLLEDAEKQKPLDAKSLYFLGMAHGQAKQKPKARDAFKRALAGGLQDPLAADAKRWMEENQKD
jgi:tetratricopeptide (TPR) repeat protein